MQQRQGSAIYVCNTGHVSRISAFGVTFIDLIETSHSVSSVLNHPFLFLSFTFTICNHTLRNFIHHVKFTDVAVENEKADAVKKE